MTKIVPALAATLALVLPLAAQDTPPSHVIVTYRVYPDKRATLKPTLSGYAYRLSHWRDQGALGPFQILANSLADDEAWEAMVVARTGNRGLELFKRFEAPDNTSLLGTTTVPADLVDRGGDGDDVANTGVFLVVPYDCGISLGQQRESLKPALADALKDGGLLGYRFFTPRFPAGRAWNGLLILHYADWPAFGRLDLPPFRASLVGRYQERVYVLAEALPAR